MADTWDGTTDASLVTGNCIRNGGANGIFTVTTTIPSALDKEALTTSQLATYTNISTGSLYSANLMAYYTSNQCPTKGAILGTF
jgi:hypothetical protein